MDQETKDRVRASWAEVAQLGPLAAEVFYKQLFEQEPRLKSLFAGVDMVRQHGRLVDALSFVVDRLDCLDEVVPLLEELGRRHQGYGVGERDYEAVGAALLATLEEAHGDAWTRPLASSWEAAYGFVAGTMQSADRVKRASAPASAGAIA